MAASAKSKPKAGNKYPPDVLNDLVSKHEKLDAECASIMGKAMSDCQVHRLEQKELLDEAKSTHGIPKVAVKNILKERKLQRDIAALAEDAEDDVRADMDLIREGLGDYAGTELGQAAMKKAA